MLPVCLPTDGVGKHTGTDYGPAPGRVITRR